MPDCLVVGAGLAGSEAAWQLARAGLEVELWEMRPEVMTPAHKTGDPAELVCSNSLGSNDPFKASGLLKEELRELDSLLIALAQEARVPAGHSLSVDRRVFSRLVREKLETLSNLKLKRGEIKEIPGSLPVILASGPLTSPALAESLKSFCGENFLYFFDAVSPVVTLASLNLEIIYPGSRYRPEETDYLNCPFNKEQYRTFYQALIEAELAPVKEFENKKFFEGCLPVEEIASRGEDTLRFGPMKPVGLPYPGETRIPYAVVQLRQEDLQGSLYGLVGFQTRLKFPEQQRVFRLIPGLEEAEFVRFGVMHRNLYLNAPTLLSPTLQFHKKPDLFAAGQITGVEGYVECIATGWLAGTNLARHLKGLTPLIPPKNSALGALLYSITNADPKKFQPTNVNFGLLFSSGEKVKNKAERNKKIVESAREAIKTWREEMS